ncbi:MAG TPA: helix-turn-helix domain-containing protein [Patescibacteria group bacterium]|jgi:carbohydrate diacid regulator
MAFTFSPPFARTVVNQVMSLLGKDVTLTDPDGAVLASYNPDAVGSKLDVGKTASASGIVSLEDGVGFAVTNSGTAVGVLVIHADGKEVKDTVPMTRSLVELLIGREADQGLSGNLDQLLWQFFNATTDAERERLVHDSQLLGLDLTKPRFVVLVSIPGFADKLTASKDKELAIERIRDRLNREITAIFPTTDDNAISYFGHDEFLILKDASRGEETFDLFRKKSDRMLANLGTEGVTAGVGGIYPGLSGLNNSFSEADSALRLGRKLHGPGKVYEVGDLGLYVVFGNVPRDRQIVLAKRRLAPLLRDEHLTKTVRAYFGANLNLTQAAKELHVHRNTLIYRLRKVKDLIGLDPEAFDDAVQLKMALSLLDLS